MIKDIFVIAGPNGAGKTTTAKVLLPQELDLYEFVNADEIARGLSPLNPDSAALAAGRLMLERMQSLSSEGKPFAFETTLSGKGHARFLQARRAEGWRITLIYLWLPDPEMAVARVARRVSQGGHAIPTDVIHRRYWGGLKNLTELYLPIVDVCDIYESVDGLRLIAGHDRQTQFTIYDPVCWGQMTQRPPA